MKQAIRTAAFATSILMTALLAACGGGGGGGSTASTGTSGNTGSAGSTADTGALSTPTYSVGSAEATAFNQLNAERQACGFPALSENTLLDQASANHMAFMQANAYIGHDEGSSGTGYTGATPQARALYVGYATGGGYVGELNGSFTTNVGGALSVVALSSVPYHEAGLFAPTIDFGMAYSTVSMGPTTTYYVPEIMLGYQGTAPALTNAPLTYPCQGATNVDYESAQTESPAPLSINTGTNPIGTPIVVMGNTSDNIALTSAQIQAPGGAVTGMDIIESAGDVNHELLPNEAVAFTPSPLQPSTTYRAVLQGTINGNAFIRDFTFTTGAQGQF
jgi:uncharacterized protein YkwD